jgi:hypothetical protein
MKVQFPFPEQTVGSVDCFPKQVNTQEDGVKKFTICELRELCCGTEFEFVGVIAEWEATRTLVS